MIQTQTDFYMNLTVTLKEIKYTMSRLIGGVSAERNFVIVMFPYVYT